MPKPNSPFWRPYSQEWTAAPALKINRAQGAFLFSESGQKIFDGISSWWLITHGHCQPEIVAAVQRQAELLDQVTFANFTHAPAEELSDLLMQITPKELTRIFLTDNGSTAVEAAIKMSIQACAQRGHAQKKTILTFERAYHGDTVGAMSASGESPFNRPYASTLFPVIRARHTIMAQAPVSAFTDDFQMLIETHHKTIAAVLIEPLIQAAGGMVVWPQAAVRKVAELCKKYDVLLIFDEVMTGFGRTGHIFAMDTLNAKNRFMSPNDVDVVPDMLCISKGLTGGTLPLAATLVREEVYEAFLSEQRAQMFFHGHSFTGNPLSCAAAAANITLFQERGVVEQIQSLCSAQAANLKRLATRFSLLNPRQCGSMIAFELDLGPQSESSVSDLEGDVPPINEMADRKTTPVVSRRDAYLSSSLAHLTDVALKHGLFLRPLGQTIYLLPPYCATTSDIDMSWEILGAVLAKL
jgi:adenosylmethionine-8-amino-7-oxononanoate aminotransferase